MKTHMAMVNGKALKYRIRRHPRAKRWKLTVNHQQGVVVTMPPGQKLADVTELLKEFEEWLEVHVNLEEAWDGPAHRSMVTGDEIYWLGVPRRLEIAVLPPEKSRRRIVIDGPNLKMELPANEFLDPRPVLISSLKKKAKEDLVWRVEYWSLVTGLVPNKVIVGERKTRWGSCSSRGTLSFCYRLVMAPPAVVDAIVVHELCHLKEPNHGRHFWALLEGFLPNYHETHVWLTDNSRKISL